MKRNAWILLVAVTATACSGNGVSTTARTSGELDGGLDDSAGTDGPMGDGGAGDAGDDAMGDGATTAAGSGDDAASMTDGGGDAPADGDTGTPMDVSLQGTWISEGANIAPLLVELTGAQKITATFSTDTFTVTTVDSEGQEVVQAGVLTHSASGFGETYDIVLEQTTPSAITVEGIYEIDDSVSPAIMYYEVVQTMPSVGAVAPTAAGGFGSTSYGDDLTQIFVRL